METQPQNNDDLIPLGTPPIPPSSPKGFLAKKITKIGLLAVFLVVSGFLVYKYSSTRPRESLNNPNSARNEETREAEAAITVQNTLDMFEQRTKLPLPKVAEKTEADTQEMLSRFAFLDYPTAENLISKKVIYQQGGEGGELEFLLPTALNDLHFDLVNKINQAGWLVVQSTRGILASQIEAKKGEVKLKISLSKVEESLTKVYAQTFENK